MCAMQSDAHRPIPLLRDVRTRSLSPTNSESDTSPHLHHPSSRSLTLPPPSSFHFQVVDKALRSTLYIVLTPKTIKLVETDSATPGTLLESSTAGK